MAVEVKKRYAMGEFYLDPERQQLSLAGDPVRLTSLPFQVLVYLIENRDRVVSRGELLQLFWDGKDVYDEALTKCMGAIRKALGDRLDDPRFIATYWAKGYRYIGPLEEDFSYAGPPTVTEIERVREVKLVVEETESFEPVPASRPAAPSEAAALMRPGAPRRFMALAAAVVTIALLTVGLTLYSRRPESGEAGASPIRSVAVLPLKNLSGDESQEYFSEGLTESLITELSKLDGLKVISRNSVFALKGDDLDPRRAGERLGVQAVLEGSVRKSDETIRVDVRLVNTKDGSIIWSGNSYDRALKDILAVQDEIACSVTAGLRLKLCGDQRPPSVKQYTDSAEAYQAYLKGRYYWNKRTGESLKHAIEHFEQAISIDPGFALAYAGLTDCYSLGVWYIPMPASEAVPKLKAAAKRAVELDDQLAEAHLAMANAYSFEWRWQEGMQSHRRAIELNPGQATAHHWYALSLALIGRFDEAIENIERARDLDPLSLVINTDVGWVYYLARRYDEAIEQYRKTLELDPSFTLAHFDLALACSQKGMHDEAIAEMLKAEGRGSDYLGGLGYVYARAGRRGDAMRALDELKRLSREQYVPPYHFAWIYTGLGEKDQAIAMLERVYEEHTQHVVDFKMHPMFDPLQSDPRYKDLLGRIGLPD